MHAILPRHLIKRIGWPILSAFFMLLFVFTVPHVSAPLALLVPLLAYPASIRVGTWYIIVMSILPGAGWMSAGKDFMLSLTLLTPGLLTLAVQHLARKKKRSLTAIALYQIFSFLLSQTLFWGRICFLLNGSLFDGLAQQGMEMMARFSQSNQLLIQLVRQGLLALPAHFQRTWALPIGDLLIIDPALRIELLHELRFLFYNQAYNIIPSFTIQAAIVLGFFTTLNATRQNALQNNTPIVITLTNGDRKVTFPSMLVPKFQNFFLPSWLKPYVLFLLLASTIRLFSSSAFFQLVGLMMVSAFTTIYCLLGAATLLSLAHKRAGQTIWAGPLAIALFIFFPTALLLLGLTDQHWDLRKIHILNHQKEDE